MSLLVDRRDQEFVLNELLDISSLQKLDTFNHLDPTTANAILDLAEAISTDHLFPANIEGDKQGSTYDPKTKQIDVPNCYKEAFPQFIDSGLGAIAIKEDWGGAGLPEVLWKAAMEWLKAGSMPISTFVTLTKGVIQLIGNHGSDKLKAEYLEKMVLGNWGGTMCLTEPDAGSDVGALRTSAVKQVDGRYKIKGQKIFITCGEHPLFENIVHAVLARTPDAPKGTKGISIFIVPKYLTQNNSLQLNDVSCSGIEDKMGIKGSPTCSINFGDNDDCYGYLLGSEGQGMAIMFEMMNEARLDVGIEALGVSSAAYMHSLDYAQNRVQGTKFENNQKKPANIVDHPDVKRMLLSMKSQVEAMRTLSYFCGMQIDLSLHGNKEQKSKAEKLAAFLIPIVKAGNSDNAWNITADAIQIYGGYGYCKEFPVEQMARDSKITSIYEGTNGIQSIDLLMRKTLKDPGLSSFKCFSKVFDDTLEASQESLKPSHLENLKNSKTKLEACINHLASKLGRRELNEVLFQAVPYQKALKTLIYGWIHAWTIGVIQPKLTAKIPRDKMSDNLETISNSEELSFYYAKLISSEYYLDHEFPKFDSYTNSILNVRASESYLNWPFQN